jgi:methylmalonyl-CoA mutase N-terminal domain/subunit
VLGGTQSLHTNSLDEAWALPSEFAATLALRTQQVIAHESGVTHSVDPLGGSYFVERFTNQMEQGCYEYFDKIDALGGMIPAIERGYPQREIAEAAYRYQQAVDRKQKIIVGVNDYVAGEEPPLAILQIDESVARHQNDRLAEVRRTRDNRRVTRCLGDLEAAARADKNTMPYILEAVRAYATLGEICDTLRGVFGTYEEVAIT